MAELRGVKLNYNYGQALLRLGTRDELLPLAKTQAALEFCQELDPQFQYRLVTVGDFREARELRYQRSQSSSRMSQEQRLHDDLQLLVQSLREGEIDFFLEELQNLPFQLPKDLELTCFLPRNDARDILVTSERSSAEELEAGSLVGLRGERRESILRRLRPDLVPVQDCGTPQELLDAVRQGRYAAAVLAAQDLQHSSLSQRQKRLSFYPFSLRLFCPAPGQGQMVFVGLRSAAAEQKRVLEAFETEPQLRGHAMLEQALARRLTGGGQDLRRLAAVHVREELGGQTVLFAENTLAAPQGREPLYRQLNLPGERQPRAELLEACLRGLLGEIHFVGIGPGLLRSLTAEAQERLQRADLLVYDNPLSELLLAQCDYRGRLLRLPLREELRSPAELDEVVAQMAAAARRGLCVTRICSGDPWFFGPAIQEVALLRAQELPIQICSGVSTLHAAAAYAGAPLTLPGFSESVHSFSGTRWIQDFLDRGQSAGQAYQHVAALPGTLVFFDPITCLPELAQGLLSAGKAPDTPALLVEQAGLPGQRRLLCALSELAAHAVQQRFLPPAVLLIGRAFSQLEQFSWWPLPGLLQGRSLLLLKSRSQDSQTEALLRQLEQQGAAVLALELVRHPEEADFSRQREQEARRLLRRLERERLLERGEVTFAFSSGSAVLAFRELLATLHFDLRRLGKARIAAYGQSTLEALRSMGLEADFVPPVADLEHLAEGLGERLGKRECLVYVRGQLGSPMLGMYMKLYDLDYCELVAYESVYNEAAEAAIPGLLPEMDALVMASPAAAHAFWNLVEERRLDWPGHCPLICLSEAAYSACQSRGQRAELWQEKPQSVEELTDWVCQLLTAGPQSSSSSASPSAERNSGRSGRQKTAPKQGIQPSGAGLPQWSRGRFQGQVAAEPARGGGAKGIRTFEPNNRRRKGKEERG